MRLLSDIQESFGEDLDVILREVKPQTYIARLSQDIKGGLKE